MIVLMSCGSSGTTLLTKYLWSSGYKKPMDLNNMGRTESALLNMLLPKINAYLGVYGPKEDVLDSLSATFDICLRSYIQLLTSEMVIKSLRLGGLWSLLSMKYISHLNPQPIIMVRNPYGWVRKEDQKKQIEDDDITRSGWYLENRWYLNIDAPVINFGVEKQEYIEQVYNAMQYWGHEFDKDKFALRYKEKLVHPRPWMNDPLPPNHKRLYDQLIARSK